jgi:uncharacterized protein YbcI
MPKGQMEDEITKALIRWEREYLGRGPTEAKADVLRNMVIVTLKGVLSQAEYHLAQSDDGMALIKKLRQQLVEQGRPELEKLIYDITGLQVISLHTDISTKTGERVFIFVLEREI